MKKRSIVILIILLAIGFAAVSTTLVLNGTIGIAANKDDFNIIFTNAKLNNVERKDFIEPTKKQTITFETNKLTKVDEEAVLDYEVTNTSKLYDGDVKIVCNLVDKDDNIIEDYEYIDISYEPKSMTVEAGKKETGSITAKLIKASTEDQSVGIKCTLDATAKERDKIPEEKPKSCSWEITEDNDNNGKVSNGDLITLCTESFYVYNTDGDTIKAIAQYNLEVGNSSNSDYPAGVETNIQSSRAIGSNEQAATNYATVQFANKNKHGENYNSYNGSIVEEYVNKYVDILKEKYNVEVSGRLITKEELETLGCDSDAMMCSSAPAYITSTSYWTSSPYGEMFATAAWVVYSSGSFVYFDVVKGGNLGVRPVIEIPKSGDATNNDSSDEENKKCDIENPPVEELNNWLWKDNDCSKDISNGDLLTIDTESFYVYNTNGGKIKAITQYNLEVGNSTNSKSPADEETNIQSPRAIGASTQELTSYATVQFANSSKHGNKMNSYTGSIVEGYVNNYVTILKERYNVEVTGRLITKEELETLGCDSSKYTCSEAPAYIYSNTYWTSSPRDGKDDTVWIMYGYVSTSFFSNYTVDRDYGVRPVIEIDKSALQ